MHPDPRKEQAVSEVARCGLCGEPMPPGEQMFQYHGYSGKCPKPPMPAPPPPPSELRRAMAEILVTARDNREFYVPGSHPWAILDRITTQAHHALNQPTEADLDTYRGKDAAKG